MNPMRIAASAATGCEGDENPSQWPIAVTLYGRGRAAVMYRIGRTNSSTARLTRKTTRCLHRRKTIVSATVRSPAIARPHREPLELRWFVHESSQEVRAEVTNRVIAASK